MCDNQVMVLINSGASGNFFDEEMMCGFSEKESNSYRVWNPRTQRLVEARNMVFIKIPPHLILKPSQLSPLQELQSPSLHVTEDTLEDNYVSSKEIFRDVRDYTAALDFNIDIPTDRGDIHSKAARGGLGL